MTDALPAELQTFFDRLAQAWDTGDSEAYADLFTKDATYVIFMGEALIGREEIERNHAEVFTRWQKGTKMAVNPIAAQALGNDAYAVLTAGGIGRKLPIAFDKLQTFTLTRDGDRWLCAAFHNTAMSERAVKAFN